MIADTATAPEEPRAKSPALLFDLDGTLVDSNYEHVASWRLALRRGGLEVPNALFASLYRHAWRPFDTGGLQGDAQNDRTLDHHEARRISQALFCENLVFRQASARCHYVA
jgi:beta-phosphoglucomutase-like phosphatase (HAD superfamily)